MIDYQIHPYSSDDPAGRRYGATGTPGVAARLISEGDAPSTQDGGDPEPSGESESSEEA
ncbi:MAG: hypothetical protein H0U12_03235 [Thermoleophilaceae bacterium]|nr:hypothetical protein [Thermoleophilaceae bacterium]